MSKKKGCIVFAALLFATTVLGLAGCGGTERTSNEAYMVIETSMHDYYQEMATEFEELHAEEGWKIRFVPVGGGQIVGKQDTMIAQRNAPDIIVGGDTHLNNQYKYLQPLDEWLERDDEEVDGDDFFPQLMETLSRDGNTYYLPEYFNTSLLYYNKSIFDEYNSDPAHANDPVSYPQDDWTYEQFLETAKKLNIVSGTTFSQYGCYSTIGWWGEWLIHVRQAGGDIMEDGLVTLNTPEAKAGFQRYYDKMFGDDKVSQAPGESDFGGFSGGKFAMVYGGHISYWSSYKRLPDFEWDVVTLPSVNGNKSGGELAVNGLGVYKDSDAKEVAWEFIKYLTRKRSAEEWSEFAFAPPRASGRDALTAVEREDRPYPQNIEAVYATLTENYSISLPTERYYTYIQNTIVQNIVTRILEGEFTISEGLDKATADANNYIRGNYGIA